jgi:TolB-like protein
VNSHTGTPLPDPPASACPGSRPLVAVLPFAGQGRHPKLRLLGADIADLLRERLAQDPQVQAILINTDFLAQAPPHALELVCRELEVGALITGRVHGPVRAPSLYVELADTREWRIHWARFFRGNAQALLAPGSPEMDAMAAGLRAMLVKQPRG